MARGRFVSKSISQSHKFSRVASHEHRLMYLLILPHADREGRVEADPAYLRGVVFTRLDFTIDDIDRGLDDLHDAGLITRYVAEGGVQVLQLIDFFEHNTPHHKELPSKFPSPSGGDTDTRNQRSTNNGPNSPQDKANVGDNRSRSRSRMEVEVEDEENDGATTPDPDIAAAAGSEHYFTQVSTTGKNPRHEMARVRSTIRRLAGKKTTQALEQYLDRWTHHSNEEIEFLWQQANPELWRGTHYAKKRRTFLFQDLLDGELATPQPRSKAPRGESQSEDLLDLDIPLSGSWRGKA